MTTDPQARAAEVQAAEVRRFAIRRCAAHAASVCWVVRQWQATTSSYVFYVSSEDYAEAWRLVDRELRKR